MGAPPATASPAPTRRAPLPPATRPALEAAPAPSPPPAPSPAPAPSPPPAPRSGSAIYEGVVFHARSEPVRHEFSYRIFMPLFDLAELPELLERIPLWSARRRAPARLRRSDHLGDPAVPLDRAARELVAAELGWAPSGPVRLLANPRYWGVGLNPVAFYYLHGRRPDGSAGPVEAMIAEVTNTPWGQSRCYVLDARDDREPGAAMGGGFDKQLHVSPFMPMEQSYRWSANEPGERLRVRLCNHVAEPGGDGRKVFEAGVDLARREITPQAMASLLVRYPPMTASTFARIYVNALKLKLKGVPHFRNPSKE